MPDRTIVVAIEGGLGKHISFTSLLPQLKEKYEAVYLYTGYPQVFENNPHISGQNIYGKDFYQSVILDPDTKIVYGDPYDHPDWVKNQAHLLNVWAEMLEIEPHAESNFQPELYPTDADKYNRDSVIHRVLQEYPEGFLLLQLIGGQPSGNSDWNAPYTPDEGLRRTYPYDYYVELIQALDRKYPNLGIFLFSLPNEPIPEPVQERVLTFSPPQSIFTYAHLARRAHHVISIDSSLMHIAAAAQVPSTIIWGETSPSMLGYSIHTNLQNKDYPAEDPSQSLCRIWGGEPNDSIEFPTPTQVMKSLSK